MNCCFGCGHNVGLTVWEWADLSLMAWLLLISAVVAILRLIQP